MALNSNQKAIRKGYNKIAKALGSVMGVYRPSNNTFVRALDERNWLFDIPFSASTNSGFQTTQEYGIPALQGFFNSTDIEVGDMFYDRDSNTTYFVGEIPLFEPPMVIQCFNTMTCSKPIWDKATRSNIQQVNANEIPCNVQSLSDSSYDREGQSFSNPDSQQSWLIKTWLPQGTIAINDQIVLDTGKKTQVTDVFNTQHGMSIKVKEILGGNYTPVA